MVIRVFEEIYEQLEGLIEESRTQKVGSMKYGKGYIALLCRAKIKLKKIQAYPIQNQKKQGKRKRSEKSKSELYWEAVDGVAN